jgi:hypothetical protein
MGLFFIIPEPARGLPIHFGSIGNEVNELIALATAIESRPTASEADLVGLPNASS